MPELPEVETIIRTLERNLMHQKVETVDFRYQPLLEKQSMYPLESLLGSRFIGFRRFGKYLVFDFSNGLSWIVHLRMEGKFHLHPQAIKPNKHTHLVITTNEVFIHYLDLRKFSTFAVVDDVDAYFEKKKMGPEPWQLESSWFYSKTSRTARHIKTVILDQKIVSGIGNIYADEILYKVQIHPRTPANRLSHTEVSDMIPIMQEVLEEAIAAGGTTIRSYTSSLNVHGRFQLLLNAYGREGLACHRCETIMERIVINGRSSVFCPHCQKERV